MRNRRFVDDERFAEVWWHGPSVETIRGKLGTRGRAHTNDLPTAADAVEWVEVWCNKRLREGFTETAPDDQKLAFEQLLAGWRGVVPAVTAIRVRGVEASLAVSDIDAEGTLASDLERGKDKVLTMASSDAATQWANARVKERRSAGDTLITGEPTLSDLPPLPKRLAALLRPVWLPVFDSVDRPVGWTGGLPMLDPTTPWPTGRGDRPLLFIAALEHPKEGWFQLFFDPEDETEGRVQVIGLGSETRNASSRIRVFERKTVAAWRAATELPAPGSLRSSFPRDYQGGTPRPLAAAHHYGTKLGGWPSWIQDDPFMGDSPAPLAQLYADPHDWMWGADLGKLYVFRRQRSGSVTAIVQHS